MPDEMSQEDIDALLSSGDLEARLGPAQTLALPDLEKAAAQPADPASVDMLYDVELEVKIELGRTMLSVEDVLRLREGSVVQLDKEAGAPGFSGFETAFAAVYTELVQGGVIDLQRLSSLMSACPARLLGLGEGPQKRGRLLPGFRADLVIIDPNTVQVVDPAFFKSRGKNSPFKGHNLYGKILMTLHQGRVVFISR